MSKTKKIIIMSGLVLLLAVTAEFNFVLAGTLPGNADTDVWPWQGPATRAQTA